MTSATPETPDASPGLRPSLEAILLVADEPVPLVVLAQVLERPRNEVEAELRDLAASYVAEGRGFDLREIAGGWRFYTREDCAPLVERFVSDVAVQKNGDLIVTETIQVWAEGRQVKRGILRDFPTVYHRADGSRVEVGFDVQSVTRDNYYEQFATERMSNGVRVRRFTTPAMPPSIISAVWFL